MEATWYMFGGISLGKVLSACDQIPACDGDLDIVNVVKTNNNQQEVATIVQTAIQELPVPNTHSTQLIMLNKISLLQQQLACSEGQDGRVELGGMLAWEKEAHSWVDRFDIKENNDQYRSTSFDFGEELMEHLLLELYCDKLILFIPGPHKSLEVARQSRDMEAPLEERVLEKQAVKLNFGTAQGKTSNDLTNENDLGPCSSSPTAREEVGGRVVEQVDLINREMDMLTVQEKFQNKKVSPKIARLMSRFEDPETIATSIVQEMEVDGLPVQEVGPMENRSSVAVPRMRKVAVPRKRKGEKSNLKVFRIDDMFGQLLQLPGVGLNKGDNMKRKQEGHLEDGLRVTKRGKGE